jgi:hypothetical protein
MNAGTLEGLGGTRHTNLLASYQGFEEIAESSLPEEAVLVHGDGELFSARFKYRRA